MNPERLQLASRASTDPVALSQYRDLVIKDIEQAITEYPTLPLDKQCATVNLIMSDCKHLTKEQRSIVYKRLEASNIVTVDDALGQMEEVDKPTDNTFMRTSPYDQEGHFQVFKKMYGDKLLYTRELGWFTYSNGFWDKDLADKYISEWITDMLRQRKEEIKDNPACVRKCEASRGNIEAIKAIAKDRLLGKLSDFNCEPHLLNVNNGVLDLRTLELSGHDAALKFNYKLPTNWNPEADMTEWQSFIDKAVDDPSASAMLKIAAGYTITGDTSAETMFYMFGPPRSGKGTFMTAVQKLLGGLSNTVNIGTLCSSSKQDNQNFELATLSLCRYITAAETGRDTYLDAGRIKNLTGNDPIQCAFKFKDSFRYTPIFKIWVSSNHEVNVDASDDAVWDRLRAFHFPNCHKDDPDTSLKRRLTTKLEPVLRWCAEGAKEWFAMQELGKPMPRTERMMSYLSERKDESDYVKQFLAEQNIQKAGMDSNAYKPAHDLYGWFKEFCSKHHIDKYMSLRNFISDMKRRGFVYTTKRVDNRPTRVFMYKDAPTDLEVMARKEEEEVPF